MLPDVSDVLTEWSQVLTLRVVTKTVDLNFSPLVSFTDSSIRGVIQVAKPETLTAASIDTSLRYIVVHTTSYIEVGNYLIDRGVHYKVIEVGNWKDAGFFRVTAEQVRGDTS